MARDLSSLPKVKPEDENAIPPDRDPFLGPAFIKVWAEQNADIIGSRPKAHDTPFRHSSAGWCAHDTSRVLLHARCRWSAATRSRMMPE